MLAIRAWAPSIRLQPICALLAVERDRRTYVSISNPYLSSFIVGSVGHHQLQQWRSVWLPRLAWPLHPSQLCSVVPFKHKVEKRKRAVFAGAIPSKEANNKNNMRRLALTAALLVGCLISTSYAFTQCSQDTLQQSLRSNHILSQTHCSLAFLRMSTTAGRVNTSLQLAKDNKGVYSRPSAAIERGSGFFIPGLEGPRVRLVFGIIVLVLTVLNHTLLSSNLPTATFPERLAIVYAVLLLLQAAIEYGKEEKGYIVTLDKTKETESASAPSYSQTWSPSSLLTEQDKDKVQWAAASYVALTPATHMLLLDRANGVIYRLGVTPPPDFENELEGTAAAFSALDKASSGRVSLSPTHPTAVSLNANEGHGRCVVLQSINDNQCWMMTSNQLLPAFTKEDLKWLGQLAKHVNE